MTTPFTPPRTAAEWFLAIHATEEPAPETVQAWLQWLDASPENRQAFEDTVQIWHGTPAAVIARPAQLDAEEEYDGNISVAEWRARQRGKVARVIPRHFALAAAAAVLAVIGVTFYGLNETTSVSRGEFITRTAEHRRIELADGSRVVLGADSKLWIDLSATARRLRLDAGEAYFTVAKDATRPFVVSALDGDITALGTAFNVRALQDRVTVTVTEGSVRVSNSDLGRDEQLTYLVDHKIKVRPTAQQIKRVDAHESARWRDGWLVYRDEPLKYVIADIARYTDLNLEVASSAADLKFSGAVFRESIDEWIVALPEVAAVVVERGRDGFVIRLKPDTVMAREGAVQ